MGCKPSQPAEEAPLAAELESDNNEDDDDSNSKTKKVEDKKAAPEVVEREPQFYSTKKIPDRKMDPYEGAPSGSRRSVVSNPPTPPQNVDDNNKNKENNENNDKDDTKKKKSKSSSDSKSSSSFQKQTPSYEQKSAPAAPETVERKPQPYEAVPNNNKDEKIPEKRSSKKEKEEIPEKSSSSKKSKKTSGGDNKKKKNGSGTTSSEKSAPPSSSSKSSSKPKQESTPSSSSTKKQTAAGRRPSNSSSSSSSSSAESVTPPPKKQAASSSSSSRAAPATPKTKAEKAAAAPPKSPASPGTPNKVQQRPDHNEKIDPYENADPSKWRTKQMIFGGSFTYETKGETQDVQGSIKKGIEKFKKNPNKYVCLFHQSNMTTWPTDQQRYVLVHRDGTSGYTPQNVGKGPMTLYLHSYERLPPFPNDELQMQYRDKYTDHMTHQGRKLHSANNLPMLPGRGMGICDTPNLKIIGDVDPSDIHQGTVGDCWLLSGISSLAEFDGAVKKLFRKTKNLDQRPLDGPNMYIVTLWDLETWTERDIEIDERLPVMADGSRKLLASKPSEDGELWVCYLEKALAVHCGGWDKITGGQCTHAWSLLTGCKEQYTIRRNDKTKKFQCFGKFDPNKKQWLRHANCPHDGDQVTWPMAWPKVGGGGDLSTEMTEEEIFQKMCAWDQVNYIIGAGCQSKAGDKGLVDNHAYSVIECHSKVAGTDIDLIKVRNPWGSGEIEDGIFDDDGPGWDKYPQIKKLLNPVVADDGIFWVTKQEFFKFFATIYLSASNMTEFLED